MSDTVWKLASKLAEDTLKIQDAGGDDRLFMEVAKVLAASSQTLEEAFLTEVRVRLSERTARAFLMKKVDELKASASAGGQA